MSFDVFKGGKSPATYTIPAGEKGSKKKTVQFKHYNRIMMSNGLFEANTEDWYYKYNRFGRMDPFTYDTYKEFLFFTKPDLNLLEGGKLVSPLSTIPLFEDALLNYPYVLNQLQFSDRSMGLKRNPFMYMLSNTCTSHLDLPSITADSHVSTKNLMGTEMSYRGHSYKSDIGFDFTLSFQDTNRLDVYMLAKIYDEYVRLCKTGTASPKEDYAVYRILDNQFSVYKIVTLSDMETIVYAAKLVGVYLTDVPRSDMGDLGTEGVKFSLSFHANFIIDGVDAIIAFEQLTDNFSEYYHYPSEVFDEELGIVNNEWAGLPYIYPETDDKRVKRRHMHHDFRLGWYK